jgi:hypothetical protein
MTKPDGADPYRPLDLTRPPGLIGLLVDHGEHCTPFLTRLPALAGALIGVATATANRFVVRIGANNHIPLNLYVAMIGDTGWGKESGLRLASEIAACGGIKAAAFASAEGLHRAFAEERRDGSDPKTQLLVQDEWGRALQQIKSEKAGHQRAVMTKAMECYGLAVGGTLKARHYANPRNNVPAVANPYMCALFATTPSTLLDALTSTEVIDGSLNRMVVMHLDRGPPLRDLDAIDTGSLPADLVWMLQRLRTPEIEVTGDPAGPYKIKPSRTQTFKDLQRVDIAAQSFKLVTVEPAALAILDQLRREAAARVHNGKLGALWARAFEHATRIAGNVAVGESCVDLRPLIITRQTAQWANALVTRCIEATASLLHRNLADCDAERTRNQIKRSAILLQRRALDDPNPTVERTAPADKQTEIRDLKKAGWFSRRDLVRNAMNGRSRDFDAELKMLIDSEILGAHAVTWHTSKGKQQRDFLTWLGDDS